MRSLYFLFLSIIPINVYADVSDRFNDVINEIVANNPTLASRKASLESSINITKSDNNLADPEVEFEHLWGAEGIGNKWSLSVSQSFDWPGVYNIRSGYAKTQIRAFELLYKADVIDLRLRAAQTLTDYVAARLKLGLCTQIKDNTIHIAESTETAYNHGQATAIDLRKSKFESVRVVAQYDAALALVESLKFELINLNGGKYINLDSIVAFPSQHLESEESYAAKQKDLDPKYHAELFLAEGARQNIKVAQRNNLPGITLGYTHEVEMGDKFNGFKVGVSLPFFSNRHRVASAIAEAESAEYNLQQTEAEMSKKLLTDYAKARNLKSRVNEYSRLFPEGIENDNYLLMLRKLYDGGQLSYSAYLLEVNYYVDVCTAYIDLMNEHTNILLTLNRFDSL